MDKFAFVVSNGPKVPKDPALRTMIRKQAMRDVAIERRKRRAPHRSIGDEDTSQDDSSGSSSTSTTPPTDIETPTSELRLVRQSPEACADLLWEDFTNFSTIIPNPLSAYDALCAKHNLNLEQMSGLTCFGVSTPIVAMLGDTTLLNSLLGHKQDTYLRYVPGRYGKVKCITAAVDCVIAKLSERLNNSSEMQSLSLYAKALQEVQTCVADPEKSKESDTICAIMLLCLYELLDPTKGAAFQQHVFGIAHLARYRKASSFTTDYDKMLLYGSLGSTVIESIMKWDHCYLEQAEWQEAYIGFTEESTWLTYRSPLSVKIHLAETHLAGLIADTNTTMSTGAVFDPSSDALRKRLANQHEELLVCMDMYRAHLMQVALLAPPQEELDLRRELLGSVAEHLIVVKRMLGALNDHQRIRLEVETQAMVLLLKEVHSMPGPRHAWLFNNHEHSVIECVVATQPLFEEDLSSASIAVQKEAQLHRWAEFVVQLTAGAHPPPPPDGPVLNPTSRLWLGMEANKE